MSILSAHVEYFNMKGELQWNLLYNKDQSFRHYAYMYICRCMAFVLGVTHTVHFEDVGAWPLYLYMRCSNYIVQVVESVIQ